MSTLDIILHNLPLITVQRRVFENVLLQDRLTFGAGDDREDIDIVGNEWQEQVDEILLGGMGSS